MKPLILFFLTFCLSANAITVNHDSFFDDYLRNDLSGWGGKIDALLDESEHLSPRDMLVASNYLYGYVAVKLQQKEYDAAEMYIEQWEPILEKMERIDSLESYSLAYQSAICAYKITISNIKAIILGPRSIRLMEKSIEIKGDNPLAIELKGNMRFYMPKGVGGDKHEAIVLYKKALSLYNKNIDPLFRWNRCAIMLCISQAYDKIGQTDLALDYCDMILTEYPNFTYIRDVYRPSLIFGEKK